MKTAQKILAPDNNKGRGVATFLGKIWKSCNITLRLLKVLVWPVLPPMDEKAGP